MRVSSFQVSRLVGTPRQPGRSRAAARASPAPAAVGPSTQRLSNMKASVSSSLAGSSAAAHAPRRRWRGPGRGRSCSCAGDAPPGHEAVGLGVVGAADQPHEFAHHVAVEPRRPEGVLGDHPARREDHEVDSWRCRACRVGEVSTVKIDGSGWSKLTVPMVLKRARSYLYGARLPCQATTSSGEWSSSSPTAGRGTSAPARTARSTSSNAATGCQEVARVGEAVGADRAQIGQAERRAVVLADVAARRAIQRRRGSARRAGSRAISPGAMSSRPSSVSERERALLRARSAARRRRRRKTRSIERFAA